MGTILYRGTLSGWITWGTILYSGTPSGWITWGTIQVDYMWVQYSIVVHHQGGLHVGYNTL